MRRYIPLVAILALTLSGCATTKTARSSPLPITVLKQEEEPVLILSIGEKEISSSGYQEGDWIVLRFDSQEIVARLTAERSLHYLSLVAGEKESYLYLPALESGELVSIKELQKQRLNSLHLSGTFVFRF